MKIKNLKVIFTYAELGNFLGCTRQNVHIMFKAGKDIVDRDHIKVIKKALRTRKKLIDGVYKDLMG